MTNVSSLSVSSLACFTENINTREPSLAEFTKIPTIFSDKKLQDFPPLSKPFTRTFSESPPTFIKTSLYFTLVLHTHYSELTENASTIQDLHFPVLSSPRTQALIFVSFYDRTDFPGHSRAWQIQAKSRTFQDLCVKTGPPLKLLCERAVCRYLEERVLALLCQGL